MDIYGNMFKRAKCQYSVNDIFLDIKQKKLVKIFNEEYFKQVNDYYKYENYGDDGDDGDDDDEQYEIAYIDYNFDEVYPMLKTKMESYGYYCPIDGIVVEV
jgi:hypothetical protein